MKIKKILISQPQPSTEKSPYHLLAEKNNLKIEFRQFIQVIGVNYKDFRQQKIDILSHTAVVFTSKTGVDHFFRISEEARLVIPENMKYFCVSEAIALYLQKYIIYRKRKIFYGPAEFCDMIEVMKKHPNEKFLVVSSDPHKKEITKLLDKFKFIYTKGIFYKTISSDLSDMKNVDYDMLVFFSPSGVKSLFENFPNFVQNGIKIASFGPNTAKAVKDAGLKLDVKAPTPEAPSMAMALEQFIQKVNKDDLKKN